MKKFSQDTMLLLGAFTGTFALVMALGLREPAGVPAPAERGSGGPGTSRVAMDIGGTEPVAVPSTQSGLMPQRAPATTMPPLPPAIPAPPLVEPPPGNEDYAPQNNY